MFPVTFASVFAAILRGMGKGWNACLFPTRKSGRSGSPELSARLERVKWADNNNNKTLRFVWFLRSSIKQRDNSLFYIFKLALIKSFMGLLIAKAQFNVTLWWILFMIHDKQSWWRQNDCDWAAINSKYRIISAQFVGRLCPYVRFKWRITELEPILFRLLWRCVELRGRLLRAATDDLRSIALTAKANGEKA